MERKSAKQLDSPKIFSHRKIGTLEIENGLIKAPSHVKLGARDGSVTDSLIEHYRKQASDGVGLVKVESAYVKISSTSQMPLFAVDDNVQLRKIFEAIHEGYMAGVSV